MKEADGIDIVEIHVDKILPSPKQSQRNREENLDTLVSSIKSYGVISPIKVKSLPNGFYELIKGEKRVKASKIAGLESIPALIVDSSDEPSLISLLNEIGQNDLSFFEEAKTYLNLMEYYGITQKQIASALGKSQSFIANKIRLLKLSPEIIDLIVENNLSERHARALLRLTDEESQRKIIKRIVRYRLNVKETEERINQELKYSKDRKAVKDAYSSFETVKQTLDALKEENRDVDYQVIDSKNIIKIVVKISK